MRQMMHAMGQKELPELKPTLEINPDHEIVRKLLTHSDGNTAEDAAWLLYDQALLMEGVPLQEPGPFVQRLNRVLNLINLIDNAVTTSFRLGHLPRSNAGAVFQSAIAECSLGGADCDQPSLLVYRIIVKWRRATRWSSRAVWRQLPVFADDNNFSLSVARFQPATPRLLYDLNQFVVCSMGVSCAFSDPSDWTLVLACSSR